MRRLWNNEHERAIGRLVVLAAAVILFGIAGSVIVQRLPPPASSLDYPEQSCFFNAQLAGLPPQASTPPDSVVYAQWFINNTGTCPWNEQVTFKHIRGNLDTPLEVVSVPSVQPGNQPVLSGQTFQPSIPITAPQQSGIYVGVWRLYALNSKWFGPEFSVTLEVVTGAPGPIPAAPRLGVDWWFVIPALIGIALAMIRSGQFVAAMYSLRSIVHGVEFMAATTFGLPFGKSITARHGEIEDEIQQGSAPLPPVPQPSRSPAVGGQPAVGSNEVLLQIGGPGTLDIKSGTAVVTERGGGFAGMYGPGEHRLQAFERPRSVIDLRLQSKKNDAVALTKDGVPVKAEVAATFKIMRQMPGEPTPSTPEPGFTTVLRAFIKGADKTQAPDTLFASREALRLATYEIHADPTLDPPIRWHDAAYKSVAGTVRDAMANRLFDQLFAPDDSERHPRQEIGQLLSESGKSTLAQRGIALIDSGFGDIVVPTEITKQRQSMWQVTWEKESIITESSGVAEGLLQTQRVRAEAQAELIQAVTHAVRAMGKTLDSAESAHPLSLHFIDVMARVVEKSLRESSYDTVDQKEISRLLDRLRKVLLPADTKKSS